MELLILIISLTIAWAIFKAHSLLKDYMWKWKVFGQLPIGPELKAYPLIGHALQVRGNPDDMYEFLMQMFDKRLDSAIDVGAGWLGVVPIVVIIGPKGAETLMHSSQHIEKSYLYTFLHSWLGTGLLTSTGDKWKTRRRLLTPTFHFSILNDFLSVMNEQAEIFTTKLEKHSQSGETFNICKNITLCTLDIICETAMGKSVRAQDNEESEYVKALYRTSFVLQERQKSPWLWPDFIFYLTRHGREYSKCLKILHGFTRSVIDERKKNFESPISVTKKSKRLAFLDLLLNVSESETALSADDIQEEVDTFMFEGHDTTAAALAWTLHIIGSFPETQQRIVDELDSVIGSKDVKNITQEDLKGLEFLERVIKESLRLFPSVPIIGRVTSEDCEFDPDRFTTARSAGRHPYAYLPFSAGPRNCIGQKFAIMEEKVILVHLLRKYRIEACDKTEDLRLMADIILRSRDGINVKLSPRPV